MMRHVLGIVFAGLLIVGGGARAQTVTALQDTTCAGARSGSLTCTAGEFTVTPSFIASPGSPQYCVSGTTFVVDVQVGLSGTNADRYDIGFFVGQQGNDPRAATLGNICSAATFPTSPLPFTSFNANACGDYVAAGVSSPIVKSVKVLCTATTGTNLGIPYTLTYNQNTGGNICTGAADVTNGAPSKCNAGSATLNVGSAPIQVAGYVDVTKRTVPAGDTQSFAFTASGSSATPSNPTFNLTDGATQRVYMPVSSTPGTLTITETATTNWETTAGISCTAQSGAPVITTNGATRTITVQLDTTNKAAACTITNTKKSRFTLAKSVGGRVAAADQFTVAATGGGTVTGTPSVTTTGTATTASTTIYSTPGTALTITDAMAAGSSSVLSDYVTKLTCTNAFAGPGATSAASLPNSATTASTSITPAPGDDITCTYTNTPKPRITKTFSPTSVGINNPSTLTLTLTNASAVAQTAVALTDNYPAGLINSTPTGALTTCGTGTITAASGGSSVALSGGTIPANGSCTITLNVTSATAGAYANTSGGASSTQSPTTGPASNTATLNVLTVPTVAKNFSPSTIIPGGTSLLTITLTNPNAMPITGASVTDTYPSGIVNTASPAGATSCGGTVAAAANGGSVVLTGGTIPSNGSCTVTTNVTTNAAGSFTNTIPIGGVTTTNGGVNTVAASATLRALAAPTMTKAFSPASVGIGAASTLTFSITNPNASDTINGLAFTDTYPVGLVNASTASTTCGGTATAASGGNTVSLSGGTLVGGASCTVTVSTTSSAAGTYNNTSGAISSTNAGTGTTASATLTTTVAKPTITKVFAPTSVAINSVSVLTLTLNNSNAAALSGASFTDTYPSGLVTAATPGTSTTCAGGSVTAAAGSTSLVFSGGTIPANGSCTVNVNVSSTTAAAYANTSGGVATTQSGSAGAGSNTATLNVLPAPTITKSFAASSIFVGGTSTLTLTLSNAGTAAVTGAAVADNYPAGLVNAASPNAMTTCTGGSVTAAAGGSSVNLAGGTIPAGGNCTVTVNVTSATVGSYTNTTGVVSASNAGNSGTASAVLTAAAKPTIAKSFSPTTIVTTGTSTLTLTLTNSSGIALSGVSFMDTYPSGLVNTATAATTTCASGSLAATAGGNSVALSGANMPAGGSCTVTVNVTSMTSGSYANTASGVSSTQSGSAGPASNTATLSVIAGPTVTKTFGVNPVAIGGVSVLTITLSNSNGVAINGVALTDTYPAGIVSTASPAGATSCGSGVVTAAANGSSVALSSGSIPANSSCTVTVNVKTNAAGSFINTIPVGGVTSTNAGANTAAASATLRGLAAPTMTKAFSPATIGVGGTSALTFTLTNPNGSDALSGLAFSDAYPSNLLNANPAAVTTTCSGSLTAADGGNAISLAGGALSAGASCTITVSTTSATTGTYNNTSGAVSSTNGGTGNAASASLTVIAKPTIVKAFSPTSIAPGGSTTLTLTLTNNSAVSLSGIAFTDNYPSGLVNTAGAASTSCTGGIASAVAGGGSVALTGATLPGNGTCTVTVGVTSAGAGSLANTSGGVSSTQSGSAGPVSNTATLNLLAVPSVAKSFGAASISIGGTTSLTITLTNPNTTAITGAAFTDTYPSGLINAAVPNASTTCGTGTASAAAGGTTLVLSGGSIAPNTSCTVTVNVSANSAGNLVNNSGPVATNNAGPGASASATLIVPAPPSIAKAFTPGAIAAGAASTLTLTITNPSPVVQTGVSFSDTYPAGLVNAATPALSNSCGGTVSGAIAGGNLVGLNGGTLAASGSCTITIQVVAASGGSYLNATGPVSSSNGGSGNTASATLNVTNKPTVAKSFSPATITTGGTSTLTLVITNQATQALSNVSITDNFPLNLTVAGSPTTNTCNGAISGATAGSTSFSLSGGSLTASGTCTISVPVTATVAATYDNTSTGVSSTESGSAGALSNTARLSVFTPPALAKSFSPAAFGSGGSSTLTLTITNTNSTALTGVGVIDNYPANLSNSGGAVSSNSCGGTPTVTANSLSLSGASVAPNSSCSVSIVVTSGNPGSYVNTTNPVTSSNGGTGNAASATLTVSGNPSINKAFSPTVIPAGGISTVTFVIGNSGVVDVTPASFSDALPANMTVAATPAISNTCGGTITANPGASAISLAGGTIPFGSSCTISVNITVSAAGSYNNVTSAVTNGSLTGNPSNTATLTATAPATIVKAFSPTTILANSLSTITFTVTNPNSVALTGLAFADTFPSGGLQVAATPNVSDNCGGTINNATAGSLALSLSGGTLGANASCTISVAVTSPSAGVFSNTTSAVTSNQTSAGTGASAALLTVVAPNLRVKKSHTGAFTIGQMGAYTITVDNAQGTAPTAGTIMLVDTLPTGLTYVSASGTGWTCSATGQIMTCTSTTVIGTGATSGNAVTLIVGVGATAAPTVTNNVTVSGGGEPASNAIDNEAFDQTAIQGSSQNALLTDGAQTALPDTVVFYAHRFNAELAGSVSFATAHAAAPANAAWNNLLYLDTNCNGILDAGEGTSPLSGSIAVNPGDGICLIIKEYVPANAPYGGRDNITLTATFTSASGPVTTLTRNDITTVGSAGGAGLVLQKSVRNITAGTAAGTNNAAKSGDTLEYVINYTNKGPDGVGSIVLTDATPSFTHFAAATCGTPLPQVITACTVSLQPAVNGTGSISWTLTGTLNSTASGSVTFSVTVD